MEISIKIATVLLLNGDVRCVCLCVCVRACVCVVLFDMFGLIPFQEKAHDSTELDTEIPSGRAGRHYYQSEAEDDATNISRVKLSFLFMTHFIVYF